MRRFETAVGIEAGIIGDEMKIAVSERAARGIEIESRADLGGNSGGSAMFIRVEFEDVVAVQVFGCFELVKYVFVAVEEIIRGQVSILNAQEHHNHVFARASELMSGGQ